MLITVVGVVFITLAVVLFSVGNFKGARVLVPIVVVAMGIVLIKGSYDIGGNQIEAKQVEDKDKTEESSSDVKDKYLKELDALSEKDESQEAWNDEANKIYDALKDRLSP